MQMILAGAAFALLVSLGTGGGMLLMPLLVVCMGYSVREARMYSLLLYIPVSVIITAINSSRGWFLWSKSMVLYTAAGMAGAAAGAVAAGYCAPEAIEKVCGGIMILASISVLPSIIRGKGA